MTAPAVHRSTARPRRPGEVRREAGDVCTFRADRVGRHFWVKPSDASSDRHTGSTVFIRQLFSWENRLVYRSQGVTDACRSPSTVGGGGPQASTDAFDCAFQVYPSGIDSGPTTLADSRTEVAASAKMISCSVKRDRASGSGTHGAEASPSGPTGARSNTTHCHATLLLAQTSGPINKLRLQGDAFSECFSLFFTQGRPLSFALLALVSHYRQGRHSVQMF